MFSEVWQWQTQIWKAKNKNKTISPKSHSTEIKIQANDGLALEAKQTLQWSITK